MIANQEECAFVEHGYQEWIEEMRRNALVGNAMASVALGIWQKASPLGLNRGAASLVKGTQPGLWENLVKLTMPRTYIFGGRSLEEFEEDRQLRGRLDEEGILVTSVPDAGHAMMAENPSEFAGRIREALAIHRK